jgi:hypothetical protein
VTGLTDFTSKPDFLQPNHPNRVAPPEMKLLKVSIREDNLCNQSSYYDESANNTSLWKDFTGIS